MVKERDEYFGPPRQVRFSYKDDDIIQRRIDAGEAASDVIRQLVAVGIAHSAASDQFVVIIRLDLAERVLFDRVSALSGYDLKSLAVNEAHRTVNAHDERLRTGPPSGKTEP